MARILVVEDMDALARVVTHRLREAGHTPIVAPTGHAALLAARAHPDVILLDLRLPDMAGEEVLRRLKREPFTAQIPVVVVSGEPDAADRVPRGGAAGAAAILQKPVGGADLCAVVDLVLEGRMSEPRAPHGPTLRGTEPLDHRQRAVVYR